MTDSRPTSPSTGGFGVRRQRFMESSDFNAAAMLIFMQLSDERVSPENVSPRFIVMEAAQAAAGVIVEARYVSPSRTDITNVIMENGGSNAGLMAGFRYLLTQSESSASLVAFVCSAARGGMTALRQVSIRVEIVSMDSRARAFFQSQHSRDGPQIVYSHPVISLLPRG